MRFVDKILLREVRGRMGEAEAKRISAMDFRFPMDRDVLRMRAFVDKKQPIIEFSSGALYHLHAVSYAEAIEVFRGLSDPTTFARYISAVVEVLKANRRRQQEGRALKPTPTYSETNGFSAAEERKIMGTVQGRGLTMLFFESQTLWILLHEVGHHKLDHFKETRSRRSPDDLRELERNADSYATRSLAQLGYSVLPMFNGMLYFAAMEAMIDEAEDDRTHPPMACRMAALIEEGLAEYRRVGWVRDDINRDLNVYMGRPEARDVPRNLRREAGGC